MAQPWELDWSKAGGKPQDESALPWERSWGAPVAEKKPDDTGNASRGFKEAFQQLPQLGYGLLAGTGAALESAVGEGGIATGIKRAGLRGYQEWGDKIASQSKDTDSWNYAWDAAKQGDIGALGAWLAHGLGYAGGQAVQMLATAARVAAPFYAIYVTSSLPLAAQVLGLGALSLAEFDTYVRHGLPVIAVDTNPGKEAFARQFGATHFICPDGPDFDLVAAVKEICPNGVDYVFECVGSTALIKTSTDLLDWGGTLVMLGVPKMGSEASFVVNTMYNDKTIMGCRYGSARPQYDIPLMVRLYQAGRLKLDELVSQTYALEDFNLALDELHEGKLARGVLTFA